MARKTPTCTLTLNIEGVAQPPEVPAQPIGGTFYEGTPTTLLVKANGANLTCRWMKNGQHFTADTP
jgi:hypothetical protein